MIDKPRPGYPTLFQAHTRRRQGGGWVAVISRLIGPTEGHSAECLHEHRLRRDAMTCARSAADDQNRRHEPRWLSTWRAVSSA